MKTTGRRIGILGTRGFPSFYGGFETAVRKLAPYLADRGWDVRVYGRRGALAPGPQVDGVTSTLTPGIPSKSLSTLSYGLTSAIHAAVVRPDVALIMNVANGFWLPLLKARGIRTIVNVDGIEWERGKWNRLARAVFRAGAWMTAKWADELVVDAQAIGDYWQERYGRAGVFIPYGGEDRGEGPLAVEAGLERGNYVLLVARLVPENSILEFLEAVPALPESIDVVIVGSAPAGDPVALAVEALAASDSRVKLLGHVSDDDRLFALWENAGAYFHGHSVGGTNPALVQAMMLGARVVARDTVFNREVLGSTGLYAKPNPRSIAAALEEMIASSTAFGVSARSRALEFYTWEIVCSRYDRLARDLDAELPHASEPSTNASSWDSVHPASVPRRD